MSAKESRGPVQKAEPSRIRYPVKTAVTLPRTVVRAWHSPVAQLVERLTVNQEVAGSSPARGANLFEHLRPLHHARPVLVPLSGSTSAPAAALRRSEEHTSELQSQSNLVCRL